MDLKEIKQIAELMKRSDLTELEIEEEGLKLRVRRGPRGEISATTAPAAAPLPRPEPGAAPHGPATPSAPEGPTPPEEGFTYVKSPMVGTFYRSAAPEMPPFVEPGSEVTESSVVCIIEAMKVMNEIQAEVKGTIVEVLVENAQAVEYGEPLFKVKTNQT